MLELTYDNFIMLLGDEEFRRNSGKHDEIERCHKFIENGNRIIIWPFANMGQMVHESLQNFYNNEIIAVDKSADKIFPKKIKVYKPIDIEFSKSDVIILATHHLYYSIYKEAMAKGAKNIIHACSVFKDGYFKEILYDFKGNDNFYQSIEKHLLDNHLDYIDMYNSLDDELSRQCFLSEMFFRLTRNPMYLSNKCSGREYFDDSIINFKDGIEGAIIDGGGYTGDTLKSFLSYKINFNTYYLFEPEERAYLAAKKMSSDKRVQLIKTGLFSENKQVSFSSGLDDASVISNDGDNTIDVVSLDTFIKENVSFIKLDIEGAELEALKGSAHIIKRDNPVLAISIYHKNSDFTDIFNYLKKINDNYKFYIRNYYEGIVDTLLYAVPKNICQFDDKI